MPTKDEAARELARKHYQLEDGLVRIFRIEGSTAGGEFDSIKLLEVNEATVAAGIMPLHFGPLPTHGIPYPSVIVEVTPAEFARIQSDELRLPPGWTIGEELPRPSADELERV